MYKTYILPILEFACPVFNPHYAKDINAIEKIQRDFVKLVYRRAPPHHQNPQTSIKYAELLANYDLELLEIRRLKICLAMFHKYIHGLLPIGTTEAFQILSSKTRGDCLKIVTKPYTKDVRCNSFFARISTIYSQLPSLVRKNAPQDFEKLLNSIDLSPFLIVKIDTFNDIL
jgi:hypothetical protein